MNLKNVTLNITDDCNLDCRYCPQTRGKCYMSEETVKKTLDFFYPFMDEETAILNFYGGEPLMAFERVVYAVEYMEALNKREGKNIKYSLTTNGILLNETHLDLFRKHRFALMLSFDGLAHDFTRKEGTYRRMVDLIKKIVAQPEIEFTTNSVFIPETVGFLADSIKVLVESGVQEPNYALSTIQEWDDEALEEYGLQLHSLKEFMLAHYREEGRIPLSMFQKGEKGKIFGCFGAKDRMAVSSDGMVWGCYLFPDFFRDKTDTHEYRKYSLGPLDEFVSRHEEILQQQLPNYSNLNQANFYTGDQFCASCGQLKECKVCPVNGALSGSVILGKIPHWICKINRLEETVLADFQRMLAGLV